MTQEWSRSSPGPTPAAKCYVSIRSYLDKTLPQLFREYIPEFFSFKTEYKPAARD